MQTAIRWALCIVGIEVLFLLSLAANQLTAVPPLAATCILLCANPQGAFARPRTVIFAYMVVGHLGLLNSVFFGNDMFGMLTITLLGVGLMAAIPCIHPPAIAIPFLLAQSPEPFRAYLVTMGLAGGVLALHLLSQQFLRELYKIDQTGTSLPLFSVSSGQHRAQSTNQ